MAEGGNKVKQRKGKILLALLIVSMMSECMGCAKKQSVTEETQEEGPSDDLVLAEEIEEGDLPEPWDDEEKDVKYPDPVIMTWDFAFAYETWKKEITQIKTPGGILPDGDTVLVCDTGNHCIVRLTTDGAFVESYGELGSETGNFIEPTAILLYEDEIYVLDSGNMRIQVFDTDMNFVREILFEAGLEEGENIPHYADMAIAGDGTIYMTVHSDRVEYGLFYIEENALRRIPCNYFSGYLAQQDGVVYAVNTDQYYTKVNGSGQMPGENWLYEVGKDGLKKICELPYMYAPADFVVSGEEIYTVSEVWGQMNRISMEGELLEALFYIKDVQRHDMYLSMYDEDTFYVADSEGYLYKVSRIEE